MSVVDTLIQERILKSPEVIEAFRQIKREDFLPEGLKGQADVDAPLPIGEGQTISQPLTVAMMMEWLDVRPGQKILDVGSGSGWTTGLLAQMVGVDGKVFAIERVPELVRLTRENLAKYQLANVVVFQGDGSKGMPDQSPFDRITVAAAAHGTIPEALKQQLVIGGILVIPVSSSIWVVERISGSEFKETEHPGFAFVPLIETATSKL